MLQGNGIRSHLAAMGALMLACAVFASGAARQDSSGDTAKKPASAATAHTTTPHKKASTSQSSATKPTSAKATSRHSRRKKLTRVRGQQKIDAQRATSIQEALIREHYLTGTATGTWDQASEDAMRRYQNDHGWQTKEVPDSRALIRLGLGPSNDHLLNPESAMTSTPPAPHAQSARPTSTSQPPTAAPASAPTSTQAPAPAATPTPTQSEPTNPQ